MRGGDDRPAGPILQGNGHCPYRALVGPLLTYISALERQRPDGTSVVTVLLPEFTPAHWWEHILHTQTALRLKGALLFRPRMAVTSVPYHLHD